MVKISKEKHATKQMFWSKHFEFSYMQIISLKNQQKKTDNSFAGMLNNI